MIIRLLFSVSINIHISLIEYSNRIVLNIIYTDITNFYQ